MSQHLQNSLSRMTITASGTSQRMSWSSNGICACRAVQHTPCTSDKSCIAESTIVCGKMKTRKAAAKRFKVTGSGKIMRRRPGKQHINEKMSSNHLKQLGKVVEVNDSDLANIAPNLPYSGVRQSRN